MLGVFVFLCFCSKKDEKQYTNDYIRRWVNEYTDMSFKEKQKVLIVHVFF